MEKITNKEQLVFQKIREYLSRGQKITIRVLQTDLGYASPRSISVLLDSIIEKGWLYKDSQDKLQISPNYTTDSYEVQ